MILKSSFILPSNYAIIQPGYKTMRPSKSWLPFLFLNMIISALVTLLVLQWWDRTQRPDALTPLTLPTVPLAQNDPSNGVPTIIVTLPPLDEPVIQVQRVIGAGDLTNEFIVIERIGEGPLLLTGWTLSNAAGDQFIFPELQLNKGSVSIFTRAGDNSVNKLYWGLGKSAWKSGTEIKIMDSAGNLRATYVVP